MTSQKLDKVGIKARAEKAPSTQCDFSSTASIAAHIELYVHAKDDVLALLSALEAAEAKVDALEVEKAKLRGALDESEWRGAVHLERAEAAEGEQEYDRAGVTRWFHLLVIQPGGGVTDGHKCSGCTENGETYQHSWDRFKHKPKCPTLKSIKEMVRVLLCRWNEQRTELREQVEVAEAERDRLLEQLKAVQGIALHGDSCATYGGGLCTCGLTAALTAKGK